MSVVTDDRRERFLSRIEPRADLPSPAARRGLRASAQLSLSAIADFCGVTRQAVSSWERGEKEPRGRHRDAYAEALNLMRGAA